MSRIGKKPIEIPDGVEVKIEKNFISVKGPKGDLSLKINSRVSVKKEDKTILVTVKNPNEKFQKSLWGTSAKLIFNMIYGVTQGYEKKLELVGVGYRASLAQNKLTLNVGFSHPVEIELPSQVEASIEKNVISIMGIDKQLVGQLAAKIRKIRPPEPYKGRGIRYSDEVIRKKAGKKAMASAG